jgi:hypothetical protein
MEDVPFETIWALEAPEDRLAEVAPADRHAWETMDAWMNIGAPENTASGTRALTGAARAPREGASFDAHAPALRRDPLGRVPVSDARRSPRTRGCR